MVRGTKKRPTTKDIGHFRFICLLSNQGSADLKAIKTISLVSRGGTIYYPGEVYPEFGIKPFTAIPKVEE